MALDLDPSDREYGSSSPGGEEPSSDEEGFEPEQEPQRRSIRIGFDYHTQWSVKSDLIDWSKDTYCKKLILNSRTIDYQVADILGQGLRTNTTLEVLLLQNCDLDPKSVIVLANGLQFNKHLQVLCIQGNPITPFAMENVFRALTIGCPALQRLNYSHNCFFTEEKWDKAFFWLSNMLALTTSLTSLSLEDIGLWSLGPLSFGLLANTSLVKLNLTLSNLQDEPCRRFWQEWLSKNGTLQSLILEECGIDEDLAGFLAAGLAVNTSLTHLDLSNNDLQASGCKAIANAVAGNKKLQILKLAWNQVDMQAGPAIGDMLEKNTSLTALTLSNNPLGEETLKWIADAMKKNNTLKTLGLQGCEFGAKGGKGWLKCMEMLLLNTSLGQVHMGGAVTRTVTEGIERIDFINLKSILPFIRNCELLNKADQNEFILALFMSTHKRLGAESWLHLLDASLISNIWTCAIVLCKAWNYGPAYHYFLNNSILM